MSNTIERISETVARLQAEGFDRTQSFGRIIKAGCTQCEFIAINGVATHEAGCPNARHECHGCNEMVPVNVRYCEECAP